MQQGSRRKLLKGKNAQHWSSTGRQRCGDRHSSGYSCCADEVPHNTLQNCGNHRILQANAIHIIHASCLEQVPETKSQNHQ